MSELILKEVTADYADQIMAYRAAFLVAGDEMDGCGGLHRCETFEEYISKLNNPNPKNVPSTQYIAVRESDNRLVGMIDLRHDINHPVLSLYGGHIGYSVHPDERRKGYATEMLAICLEKAKELGLPRVMISCVEGNIGSEKTILNNGGEYQTTVTVGSRGENLKRFWIELT